MELCYPPLCLFGALKHLRVKEYMKYGHTPSYKVYKSCMKGMQEMNNSLSYRTLMWWMSEEWILLMFTTKVRANGSQNNKNFILVYAFPTYIFLSHAQFHFLSNIILPETNLN